MSSKLCNETVDCKLCDNTRVVISPDKHRAYEQCPECYDVWDHRTWRDKDLAVVAGRFPNAIAHAQHSINMDVHMAAGAQTEIDRRAALQSGNMGYNNS